MENFTLAGIITLVVLMTVSKASFQSIKESGWDITDDIQATSTYTGECCSAYTDLQGEHHDAMLCTDYCCVDISASFSAGINAKKTCCDDIARRVPQDERQDECVDNWLSQHIWVPIVSGIVFLIILIACCTCCCCCGCCGCCRRNQSNPGVIVMHNKQPRNSVRVSSQMSSQMTNQMTNPAHQGYDQ